MKTRYPTEPRKIVAAFYLALSIGFVMAQTPNPKVSRVSSVEFDKVIESAHKDYLRGSTGVPDDEKIEGFDRFYDTVAAVVKKAGSFSDGGIDPAEFASSRYVDLSPILVVVNAIPVTDSLISELIVELSKLQGVHGVVFDGVAVLAVFSDGRVLRCE